ncbi:DUF1289 domain-containing protein [Defluviimonas sp. WL0050]|uniref:DUF1289 domain-containing protein n=1 Tax=Albidovulum litorale TaxID=2984134 RepID=A0ABT2ZP98_9RHOB|nr:DUF1289 domain-containing protein [Defluviimonas sp. WL0050]MCV2872968.1 DUF1289 domain-containing protein [Defluviimonas sp. WL0050]
MSDEVWKRQEVDSPCIKICTIHPAERLCVGCLRSIDEIAGWGRMSPEERRAIMADLPSRAPRLRQRRGGRAVRMSAKN